MFEEIKKIFLEFVRSLNDGKVLADKNFDILNYQYNLCTPKQPLINFNVPLDLWAVIENCVLFYINGQKGHRLEILKSFQRVYVCYEYAYVKLYCTKSSKLFLLTHFFFKWLKNAVLSSVGRPSV